nr:WPP domain-interacting tail-anchored protein 1-like [Tanacetum cinerariifolium]
CMQIASLKHENKILVKSLRKRDEGHAGILSHGDKASSDFSTDNKEAISSNSEVEMASNETLMDSTEAVRNIDARKLKLFGLCLRKKERSFESRRNSGNEI